MIQESFVDAIDTFISNDADLVDAFGQKYGFNIMEQGTSFPYLVYTWVSNLSDRDSVDYFENPLIELAIFSDEHAPTEINTLTTLVMTKFDNLVLTIDGYTNIKFRRTIDFFTPAGAESRRFWDKRIRYETEFQRIQ